MTSHTFMITLPQTFAEVVQRRISSGEFESESDVVISALMALEEEEEDALPDDEAFVNNWLRETVVPIALRMEADPHEGHSAEEVMAHLEDDLRAQEKRPDAA